MSDSRVPIPAIWASRASEKPIRLASRSVSSLIGRWDSICFSRSTICWIWSRNQGSMPVMRWISACAQPRSSARFT